MTFNQDTCIIWLRDAEVDLSRARSLDDEIDLEWDSEMTRILTQIQNHVTALLERHGEKE